ncbi:hypothetical protein [Arthrobacter sp. PAMC 25486]|uniref:hypothetical protein n=1 Tax=Arthrobacter sp. PAMC 25486 TaxID=1494608 RepID=UPI00056FF237|nr:hypothetical protein [Arthrobacter sp. PAMC 25486]
MTGNENPRNPEASGPDAGTGAECLKVNVYQEEQEASWAKEDSFSMRYGAPALLTGWFVTFFVFCLGLTVASVVLWAPHGMGWGLLPLSLVFGFPFAAFIGLPLAILIAWPLRRVRDQRLHVLALALAVGAAMGVVALFSYRFEMLWAVAALAAWAAVSAAIGRAVVINMVARRN